MKLSIIDEQVTPAPMGKLYVMDTAIPWFVSFKGGFSSQLNDWMRSKPGCKFSRERSYWYVPVEFADEGIKNATANGFQVDCRATASGAVRTGRTFTGDGEAIRRIHAAQSGAVHDDVPGWVALRDYQQRHGILAASNDRWIEGSEMGLGKSPIILAAAQLRNVRKGVVVDMPPHRRDWFDPKRPDQCEFGRWWPGHPDVEVIEDGKRAGQSTASIRIVSYHLLHKLDLEQPVDFIWFDEFHMLQNPETLWSKAAVKLISNHPAAWRVGLTATLVPDQIMTMHNLLDTLWPGRFGTKWDFGKAYSQSFTNDFGKLEFSGINEERAGELRWRLSLLSARTTKHEVAHMLPPFNVRLAWTKEEDRIDTAVELALGMLAQVPKVTVLSHLRETSQVIARHLQDKGIEVYLLTGEETLSPRRRHEVIHAAKQSKTCAVVSTLHSIKEGISLTFAPKVIYAELYQRPVEVLQSLGRFNRMDGSTESADLVLLANEAGDPVAEALLNKIKALSLIWKAGATEEGMVGIGEELRSLGLTPEEADQLLRAAASEQIEDDYGT